MIEYTIEISKLTARSEQAIISGEARGIDQAAMRGALELGESSAESSRIPYVPNIKISKRKELG